MWIYLSPHFDDVALSCGGLVWEQVQAGERVEVWTVCAGEPAMGSSSPFARSLQERWGTGETATQARRREDEESCRRMGAAARYFSVPDCIYRTYDGVYLYDSEESLFGQLHPAEAGLVQRLAAELAWRLRRNLAEGPAGEMMTVVAPLTLGGHVDHRLVRAASELLAYPLRYYADYPYALKEAATLETLRQQGWSSSSPRVRPAGLEAWIQAVAAHASQISTFWPDEQAMGDAIRAYGVAVEGAVLWSAPAKPEEA